MAPGPARRRGPTHVIGVAGPWLAAARSCGCPGRRIAVGAAGRGARRASASRPPLADLAPAGRGARAARRRRSATTRRAVVFTSGATGPAKGVVYRHRQVQAQLRRCSARRYGVTADDRLVAAFAPFALYGPALGIASAVPDMDVTAPGTLTAAALADAVGGRRRDVVFASPAALRNVVATAGDLDAEQRAALGRGAAADVRRRARCRPRCCEQVRDLLPNAELHTPYGMTEVLPVADISLGETSTRPGRGDGVCVGPPLAGRRGGGERRSTATASPDRRADHRRAGRDRRDLRPAPRTSRTATTALGHRAAQRRRDAGLAPHRRRRAPRRRGPAVGRGPAGARRRDRRRAGDAGRGRAAGRGGSPRVGAAAVRRVSARRHAAGRGRRRGARPAAPAGAAAVLAAPALAAAVARRRRAPRRGRAGRAAPCRWTSGTTPRSTAPGGRWAERVLAGGRIGTL